MVDTATPPVPNSGVSENKKIEKAEQPDEEAFQAALKKAEKEHADAKSKYEAAKAKLEPASNKNSNSPSAKRRAELLSQLKEIREKQAGGKAGRNKIFEDIKKTDEKLKSMITERKSALSKTTFKSVDDLDREMTALRKNVDSGTMKLVEEKKALERISKLGKERKQFAGFDESQKQIDETKKKLADMRSTLDDPESKALSEKYTKLQAELDVLKSEQDEVYNNISALRANRDKLQAEEKEKYQTIRKLKDDNQAQKRAFKHYEYQLREKYRERRRQDQEEFENKKKLERAQKHLAEASEKAYLEEIRRSESLLRYLDPSYQKESAPLKAPSQLSASAQRTVDDSGLKGMKVVSKKDVEEDYFTGTGGKKGKKNKKATDAPVPSTGKFSCPPAVMADCTFLGIDPPMSAGEVEGVREKVKVKLEFYQSDQDAQTARNIAKAKKEVEKFDSEDASSATPTEIANGHGETKATASIDEGGSVTNEIALEEAAAADVASDLKAASLEDKQ